LKEQTRSRITLFFASKKGTALLLFLLLFSIASGLLFGSASFTFEEFFKGLAGKEEALTANIIIYYHRLPRVLGAAIAGIGLSVSGVLLQTVTSNDLASPNIIGVNSGAGLFCILLLVFFPMSYPLLPLVSFIGAFAATLVITAIGGKTGGSKTSFILAGIALTSLINGVISFITLLDDEVLSAYNAFSIGGLKGVETERLIIPAFVILTVFIISYLTAPKTELLLLGDDIAGSLGVHVSSMRISCLICASASAAASVSFAGLLGFVGLVIPHIARKLSGISVRNQLITSSLCGGILVVCADTLGRTILAPTEIPVGIIMAFIGAPFLFFMIIKSKNYDNR